jgi:hypothetical protein
MQGRRSIMDRGAAGVAASVPRPLDLDSDGPWHRARERRRRRRLALHGAVGPTPTWPGPLVEAAAPCRCPRWPVCRARMGPWPELPRTPTVAASREQAERRRPIRRSSARAPTTQPPSAVQSSADCRFDVKRAPLDAEMGFAVPAARARGCAGHRLTAAAPGAAHDESCGVALADLVRPRGRCHRCIPGDGPTAGHPPPRGERSRSCEGCRVREVPDEPTRSCWDLVVRGGCGRSASQALQRSTVDHAAALKVLTPQRAQRT